MKHWYDLAACRGVSVAVFFPDADDDYSIARQVCATCPVRKPCLDEAQRARINHGMFGGLTPNERRAARRRAGRAA